MYYLKLKKTIFLGSCSPDCQNSTKQHFFFADYFSPLDASNIMSQSCIACPSNHSSFPLNFTLQQELHSEVVFSNKKQQQQNPQRVMGFAPPPGKSASASPYKDM